MLSMPLAPVGDTPRRYTSPGPREASLQRSRHVPEHPSQLKSILRTPPSPCPAAWPVEPVTREPVSISRTDLPVQLRDAELSVDFLCKKFEALTDQLHHEEQAREAAERRGLHLSLESKELQDAKARCAESLVSELSSRDSALAALQTKVACANQQAAKQAHRIREEHAAGILAEQRCAVMSEECRQESERCDQILQQLAVRDRESVCLAAETSETGRRLRQAEQDQRVIREDLRIEAQRSLLVQNELQSLEQELEAVTRAWWLAHQDGEQQKAVLQERHREAGDREAGLKDCRYRIDESRNDRNRTARHLTAVEDQCFSVQSSSNLFQQELMAAQQDVLTKSMEIKAEAELASLLHSELGALEVQIQSDTRTLAGHTQEATKIEAFTTAAKEQTWIGCREKESLSRRIEELICEGEQLTAVASGFRRARHAEDLAFEDVQGELQAAFRRKEALVEDITVNSKACDALAQQLRQLRPEIAEADERAGRLEVSVAQRSRDLENELLRERSARQDVAVVKEALREVQNSEMRMEAELVPFEGPSCKLGHRALPGNFSSPRLENGYQAWPRASSPQRPSSPGSPALTAPALVPPGSVPQRRNLPGCRS
eukprot:TRINITY_DN45742_c0_g1_i1.p1 TRINITY_DN45742_c0_g1~~TRINITY_DN45742_c0_g1_i1.p1  ORF type:complete len:641 (+),score=128.66 TRINITY_DN45742_c0_g1_i1:111-1925(+)